MLSKFQILIIVFALGIILRFFQLGSIPKSLNWDEVSNGYNAYSIQKTSKDEYGQTFPLYNRSFDDYKPPLYMYLNIPSVTYFGLNAIAVRLPSAIFGSLTILIMYFFTLRLTGKSKISIISAFLIAVFHWTVHFSRVGFEANISLFFILSSFTTLMYAVPRSHENLTSRHKILLIISALLFGITFYSYHSARIFSPLMLIATILIYFKEIKSKISIKFIFLFLLIPAMLILPFFIFSPKDAGVGRFKTVSLDIQKTSTDDFIKFIVEDNQSNLSRVVHNKNFLILRQTFQNYLTHFGLEFIFIKGDQNPRHVIENFGLIPLFLFPVFLFGAYNLVEIGKKKSYFIFSWLFLAPIAAAPADAAPHAIRSLPMVVSLSIIIAVGLHKILLYKKTKILVFLLTIFFLHYYVTYLHEYYFHYSKNQADFWMFGYKEAVEESMKLKNKYPMINVGTSLEQSYIFWLFYTKQDPAEYQANINKPDIYNIKFKSDNVSKGEIFLSLKDQFKPDLKLIDTIYYPNGEEAIKIGLKE